MRRRVTKAIEFGERVRAIPGGIGTGPNNWFLQPGSIIEAHGSGEFWSVVESPAACVQTKALSIGPTLETHTEPA